MVVRLGAVSGVGHGRLIFARFGKFWGTFSVADLFIINAVTVVAEFIGVEQALSFFGMSATAAVVASAVLLFAVMAGGTYRYWERFLVVLVIANFATFPMIYFAHASVAPVASGAVPSLPGGLNASILLLVAVVGTTVEPWQLFFQQSNVVDKRITPRWMNYERLDTGVGVLIEVIGALVIMAACAFGGGLVRLRRAGCGGALASSGEALELPCMYATHPVVRGRRPDPRVAENLGVTQGVHVRAILADPCVCLIGSADGPVAGDEDIDALRRALEQPQRGKIVLDRVRGVVQVEHRNQDIRKHVAGDENPAFLDQQRRMARGMRVMLDNPDLRAIPRNLRHIGGQAGNEAEQVQRYLLGDVRRYQLPGDAGLRARVRQLVTGTGRAAGRWRRRPARPTRHLGRTGEEA
jgi:Natural resistance-associated macrophage protein